MVCHSDLSTKVERLPTWGKYQRNKSPTIGPGRPLIRQERYGIVLKSLEVFRFYACKLHTGLRTALYHEKVSGIRIRSGKGEKPGVGCHETSTIWNGTRTGIGIMCLVISLYGIVVVVRGNKEEEG